MEGTTAPTAAPATAPTSAPVADTGASTGIPNTSGVDTSAPAGNVDTQGGSSASPISSGSLLDTPSSPQPHSPDSAGGDPSSPTENLIQNTDANKPWTDSLPESFRDNVNVSKYKSMDDFMTGHMNAIKKLGEKGIERPTSDADQATWDAYYERIGRPTTPDGYTDWKPEEVLNADGTTTEMFTVDPEMYKGAREEFHRLGLNDEQAQGVMSLYANTSISQSQSQADIQNAMAAESQSKLRQEWGDKFDAKMKSLVGVADSLGIKQDLLDAKLGNNYNVIKMLDKIRGQMGEAQITGDNTITGGGFQDRLNQIMSHPAYKDKTHPDHHRMQQQRLDLYKQKY